MKAAARFVQLLRPPPAAERLVCDDDIARQYRYWQFRILYASLIGYALFYFVRKNLSLAMPAMETELGIGKAQLGLFLTLHGLVYGVSKFANGFLGDRTNPRYFMALGLLCSAAMNVGFGLSSGVATFALFWLLNGWFQGMGFPPCARSLTQWFAPKQRGTWFAVWNVSHSLGAGLVLLLCTVLVGYDWRLCFLVPAGIAVIGAVFLVYRLRDTPESLGLPGVDDGSEDIDGCNPMEGAFGAFVIRNVLLNPAIWLIGAANFFVYTVRYALLDWGPIMLTQVKGIKLEHAGLTVAGYEFAGIAGMLLGGWMTDKLFGGKAARVCMLSMLLCGACILAFWKLPSSSPVVYTLLLWSTGFAIYGPQCLVGVIAANVATRRAAATAIGLTGFFGYLSGILSGWGLGVIAQTRGWDPVFLILVASALAGAILFAACWNAGRRTPQPAFPVVTATRSS